MLGEETKKKRVKKGRQNGTTLDAFIIGADA